MSAGAPEGGRALLRRRLSFVVVGGMLAATIMLALLTLRSERDAAEEAERQQATRAALALTTAIELRTSALAGLHGLYTSAEEVSSERFRAYVRREELIGDGLRAAAWTPRVPRERRGRWERRHERAIVEVGWRGVLPAADRVDLYPVTYLVGAPNPSNRIGVDSGYSASRRDAIRAAGDTGATVMTRPLEGGIFGREVAIYTPVYTPGRPTSTVLERRAAVRGFIVGNFSVAALERVLVAELPDAAAFRLRDANRVFAGSEAPLTDPATLEVEAAGRTWAVAVMGAGPSAVLPALVLFGGLALTTLAGAIFVVLGRRERYAFALVERRLDERRRAEEALDESQARFRALVEASPEAILVLDEAGVVLGNNPGARALLGRPGIKLAGHELAEMVDEADRPGLRERLLEAGARGTSARQGPESEVTVHRPDGSRLPVELTLASWTASAGRLFSAVLRDVSERRRREEEVRRERDYATTLLASIQDGLVVKDREGRIVEVNERFCAMVGYPQNELVGAAPPLPHWTKEVPEALAQGLADPDPSPTRDLDAIFRRRDGECFPVLVTGTPLHDEHGEVAGSLWTVKDVTERQRAALALRENEARFRLLAENSHDLIGRHALDGAILYLSPACRTILGYEPERLVGRSPYELVHPDDLEAVRLAYAEILAHREGTMVTYRLRRRDDAYIWLETVIRMIRDPGSGELVEIQTSSREVTERKRVESARESEQRFLEALLDNLSEGVAACDDRGEVVVMNRAARRLLGLPDGAVTRELMNGFFQLYTPRGEPLETLRMCPFGRATRGEVVRAAEVAIERRDGERRTVLMSGQPIRDAEGRPSGAVATLHDVTERRRAEEALFEARERFERAFENAPVGIALVSALPESAGRLLHVNQALCDMLGSSPSALRGATFQSLTHPDDVADDVEGLMAMVRNERTTYRTEKRYLRADGSSVWVRLDASLVREASGRPLYAVSQIQDISERHALEQMKDEFVAVASHELRTPLTSVLGYLALVMEGEAGALNREQRAYLAVAETSAERLLHLADDLLLVARSDAGRLRVEMEELDLPALVGSCVQAARPMAEENDIALSCLLRRGGGDGGGGDDGEAGEAGEAGVPIMLGDATRLAQVVDNLLSNALKFTPPGGAVQVRLGPHEGGAALEVSDSGPGIPAQEQARLFERFYRTASASRDAVPGTGLGLAIIKMIVDAHDGHIAVRSAEGEGTTFRIELPHAARPTANGLFGALVEPVESVEPGEPVERALELS